MLSAVFKSKTTALSPLPRKLPYIYFFCNSERSGGCCCCLLRRTNGCVIVRVTTTTTTTTTIIIITITVTTTVSSVLNFIQGSGPEILLNTYTHNYTLRTKEGLFGIILLLHV